MSHWYLQCFVFAFLVLAGTGCNKFLDIAGPDTKVDAAVVYTNNEMPAMVLAQIYGSMFNQAASPYDLARLTGVSGDELIPYSDAAITAFYTNQITPSNAYLMKFWTACYAHIRDANDVYWNSRSSIYLDTVIKKQVMAEALFLRAYWYFNLYNLFGDIPVPTTIDARMNATLHRLSKDEVYGQIESDLKTAQNDPGNAYLGADRRSPGNERVMPNKATASALLARLYLYWGKYNEAEEQASSIIAMNDTYALVPLDSVFLKNSKEAIWQLMAATPNDQLINTSEGNGFILNQAPRDNGQCALNNTLINAFENGDQRKSHWITVYHDRSTGIDYYYPYKYKIKSGTVLLEYSMIFRLAEQYLIRAEANAYQGKLPAALADLNMIRKRAGLSLLSYENMTQASLLKTILEERQSELFTEQGHRWFDLKRTGNIDAVMSVVCPLKSGIWYSTSQLWPIPDKEMMLDPNLTQNAGY